MKIATQGIVLALLLCSATAQAQTSLEAGKKAFQECIACHAVEKGVHGVASNAFLESLFARFQ